MRQNVFRTYKFQDSKEIGCSIYCGFLKCLDEQEDLPPFIEKGKRKRSPNSPKHPHFMSIHASIKHYHNASPYTGTLY